MQTVWEPNRLARIKSFVFKREAVRRVLGNQFGINRTCVVTCRVCAGGNDMARKSSRFVFNTFRREQYSRSLKKQKTTHAETETFRKTKRTFIFYCFFPDTRRTRARNIHTSDVLLPMYGNFFTETRARTRTTMQRNNVRN